MVENIVTFLKCNLSLSFKLIHDPNCQIEKVSFFFLTPNIDTFSYPTL